VQEPRREAASSKSYTRLPLPPPTKHAEKPRQTWTGSHASSVWHVHDIDTLSVCCALSRERKARIRRACSASPCWRSGANTA